MKGLSSGQNFFGNFSSQPSRKEERENLSAKSRLELTDILCREERLCNNKKFLAKLPDKGAKILKFYEEVKTELQKRDNQEKLCGELAKLTVDESKNALDRLEWTGNYRTETTAVPCEDDDTNLFRILATHSGTEVSKHKNIKTDTNPKIEVEPPSTEEESPAIDAYAKELCLRFDSNTQPLTRKKFYAHKSLNRAPVTSGDKSEASNDSTVPSSRNIVENSTSKVKTLSLQESLNAQHQQNKVLKEIEFESAIEKLRSKFDIQCRNLDIADLNYRDHSDVDSDDEVSEVSSSLEESDY